MAHARPAPRPPPGGHRIARHPTRAMRLAVLNPVRNTCFVTGLCDGVQCGCGVMSGRVGGGACVS
eukprot:4687734-Prymnesium_polylepis.1